MNGRVGLTSGLVPAAILTAGALLAADCNVNGIADAIDLTTPAVWFEPRPGAQLDEFRELTAAGDFDGDGDLDVAAARPGGTDLLVLANDGAARFEVKARRALSGLAKSLAAADFDADGDADVAVAVTLAIEIHWSAWASVFDGATRILIGSDPDQVMARDLDGDGDADLVTANFLNQESVPDNVSVLLNEGGGRFARARNFVSQAGAPRIAAGDVDGDGRIDLVAGAIGLDDLVVLRNAGAGEFLPAEESTLGSGFSLQSLAAGDLDGRPGADVVVTGGDGTCLAFMNREARLDRADKVRISGVFHMAFVDDLNADRSGDLILTERSCSRITVRLGDGSGSFSPLPALDAGGLGVVPLAADWNGDGLADLAGTVAPAHSSPRLAAFLQRHSTASRDCNRNAVPDECEPDCNRNEVPDDCDVATGGYADCDLNGHPDECDSDCDRNGSPDACDIRDGVVDDCDASGIPDACELGIGDGDGNGLLDACEIQDQPSLDCDGSGSLDARDVQPSFALSQEEFATGHLPVSLTLADFDGDGDLDAATGGRDSGDVTLLANPGDGTFAIARAYPLAVESPLIAAADLDADGAADLIAAGEDPDCAGGTRIRVSWNEGGFRFRRGPSHRVEWPARSIGARDADGDGILDLFVATETETEGGRHGKLWLLRGRAGGALSRPEIAAGHGGDVAAADLDGDRDVDFAADNGVVLVNRGDGTYVEAGDLGIGGPASQAGVEAGDFDGDGDLDLAANEWNKVLLFFNGGRAAFTREARAVVGGALGRGLIGGDLDGDGDVDLAGTDYPYGVIVKLNAGGGDFPSRMEYGAGRGLLALAAGDADGDGDLDLLTANSEVDTVSLLRNLGAGAFSARTLLETAEEHHSLAVADFDGDGDQDLASCLGRGSLFFNDGQSSFVRRGLESDVNPIALDATDFDGDGDPDLVLLGPVQDPPSRLLTVLLNSGSGSFRPGGTSSVEFHASQVTSADLDGEGTADVILHGLQMDGLIFYLNRGDGRFGEAFPLAFGIQSGFVFPSDLDGDGDIDLLVADIGETSVWKNSGVASFAKDYTLPAVGGPTAMTLGDFDGNGTLDLATGFGLACESPEECDGQMAIFFDLGAGAFPRWAMYPLPGLLKAIAATDIDGDGDLDLALSSQLLGVGSQLFSMLLNDGSGDFRPWGRFSLEWTNGPILPADLDGNDYPDLAVVLGKGIAIYWNRTLPPRARDAGRDGVPDACAAAPFVRGDADQDGAVALTDAVVVLGRLFLGGDALACESAGDANDDGKLDLTDPIRLLLHLFAGHGPLPEPTSRCRPDPTGGELSCVRFAGCG